MGFTLGAQINGVNIIFKLVPHITFLGMLFGVLDRILM
jgi:hypothetical protein